MTDRMTGRNTDRTTESVVDRDTDPGTDPQLESREPAEQAPRTRFAEAEVDGQEVRRTEFDRDTVDGDPVDQDTVDQDTADRDEAQQDEVAQRQPTAEAEQASTRIFSEQDAERFRGQWRELQAAFVDEPRTAVQQADSLVTQLMDTLTSQLTEQKRALNGEWDRDGDVDTEALRLAMRRYRAVFDQMLLI
jgi:hypothetical protein